MSKEIFVAFATQKGRPSANPPSRALCRQLASTNVRPTLLRRPWTGRPPASNGCGEHEMGFL